MSSLFNIGDKIKINKFKFLEDNPPFAGYSLKSIDIDNIDTPLVEVTREDDQVSNFTESEIVDGTLESFVTSTDISNIILGSGQKLCFSLRNAYPGYTGNVVRVKRDIDNAEQDFTADQVNDGTMVSFITAAGPSNGFVSIWYDQSPSGQNAFNTSLSNAPKIYDSVNGLYLINNKPSIYFLQDHLRINDFDYGLNSDIVFNTVTKVNTDRTYSYFITHWSWYSGPGSVSYMYYSSRENNIEEFRFQHGKLDSTVGYYRSGFSVNVQDQLISTASFNLLESIENEGRVLVGTDFASKNFQTGSADDPFNDSSNDLLIGAIMNNGVVSHSSSFNIQEISVWTDNFSDNELRFIQEQTNEYYNLHSSDTLLNKNIITNGYVSKLYDQFGSNTAVQADKTKMPIIYKDGQVVKLNGEPALKHNNDYLEVPNSTSEFKFLHDGSPNSVFTVGSFDESDSTSGFFGTNGGGSGSTGIFLELTSQESLRIDVTKGIISNFVSRFSTTSVILANEQFFIHFSSDADNVTASERLKVSLNFDSFIQDNVETNAPSTSNASYNLQIGAVGGNARPMNGFFQELLIFNTDQTINKSTCEYQIFYKYGYTFWYNGLEELFNTSNLYFSG